MILAGGGWYRVQTDDWNPEGNARGGYVGYGIEHATPVGTLSIDPLVIHITTLGTTHADICKMGFTFNVF